MQALLNAPGMVTKLATSALALVLATGACTASSAEDDDLVFESDDAKADVVRPYGEFHVTSNVSGDSFTTIQINEDRSHRDTIDDASCPEHPCFAYEGSYRFAASHGKTYMRLYVAEEGSEPATVEYKQNGDELSLRTVGTEVWDVMTKNAAPVTVTEADAGSTIDVAENTDLVLRLAANATTGYSWQVTGTDNILGYPFEAYEQSSTATGGGGSAVLTWTTAREVSALGPHPLKLGYQRGSDTPVQTFELTVNVTAAQ